jgi:hypothetical protein
MTPTAIEGGFIESLDESNQIIRRIVEARNAARGLASLIDTDEDGEIQQELREETSIEGATPSPEPNSRLDNPKDLIGSGKLPLHLWPTTATAAGCVALLNGALKYGRCNWRVVGVRASIYVDACQRHLAAWFEGQERDEEGIPHLGAALACLAILVDCQAAGLLRDDRNPSGGHQSLLSELTPLVKHLQALHSDKNPRHYTIHDA